VIEELNWREALFAGVRSADRQDLVLEFFIPASAAAFSELDSPSGRRLSLSFAEIENHSNVERFFFGGRFRGYRGYLDQVLELRRTRSGWSLELKHRGRVAIKTPRPPELLEDEWIEGRTTPRRTHNAAGRVQSRRGRRTSGCS